MNEASVQIESLLKKYGKNLETIIFEKSEGEVQEHKEWTKRLDGGVGVISRKQGNLVLLKHTPEAWSRDYQYWSFPGGGVEHGEAFEAAAVREFKEETGLDVKIIDLIAVYKHVNRSPEGKESVFHMAVFKGEVTGGEIRPALGEISKVELFKEIPKQQLVPWVQTIKHVFDY